MSSHFSSHDIIVGLWRLSGWNLRTEELAHWPNSVLELGIDSFDLADIYGQYTCEEIFGEALVKDPSLRERIRLITKCDIKLVCDQRPEHTRHVYDTSKAHIVQSVENSLRVLHTDHVDVLLLHRPDPLMDPNEVAEAFRELKRAGKVLSFGVSNFSPSQFAMLAAHTDEPLVTNQVEASVLHLEAFTDGSLDQCLEHGIRPMAWSPLGGGRLFTDSSERDKRVRETLDSIANAHGVTSDVIAFAFLLRHPSRMHPITGTGRFERIQAAARATNVQLSREEWFEIWCASTGQPLP